MRINRRTVLLGLGTVSAGVGGAFGSGAFTSVEAARTVELDTSDDSNAVLSFEANNPGTVADNNVIATEDESGTSLIKIKQGDLNERATTRFEDALKVSNNGEKNVGVSVNPDESDDPNNLIGTVLDIEDTNGNSIVGASGGNAVDLDSGTNITLTVTIDLRGGNTGSAIDSINDIVFAARQEDHSSA